MKDGPVVQLVDTHAHLEMPEFSKDLGAVLERARAAGVVHICTVGSTLPDSREAVRLTSVHEGLSAVVGIHPHDASLADDSAFTELAALASHPRVVAVGETGLDFHYDRSPRPVQAGVFRRHLALAREAGLPAVLHIREAYTEALSILREEGLPARGAVLHCFSGGPAEAEAFLALGLFFSFTGTVTFPSQRSRQYNREVLPLIPLDRLMVETDCPFLAPHPHRGQRNEPSLVGLVAERIGVVRGLSKEDVARLTTRTAARFFRLPIPPPASVIAYSIRDSVYLNVTSRCNNACVFCRRRTDPQVKGHDLRLERDPTAGEMMSALDSEWWAGKAEVVFCGYGEPTLRLQEIIEVASRLKSRGARRIRLNTNGLGSLAAGRDIVPDLAGKVDAVSVSLNAQDAETYARLCRPSVKGAYEGLLSFARGCLAAGIETTLTAIPQEGVDLEKCRDIAEGMGAGFRVRPLDEVG